MVELTKAEREAFFRELNKFVKGHKRFKYPLHLHYSISKQTISVLRELGKKLKRKHSSFIGISVYGSRARGYAMMPEDDFDLVLFFDGSKFSKNASHESRAREIRAMVDELSQGLKGKNLYPCEAGIDYYDLSKLKLTPRQRLKRKWSLEERYRMERVNLEASMNPFWLFHGLPVVGTTNIIKAREKFLELVTKNPAFQKEWGSLVRKLQARYDLSFKAAVRILSSVKKDIHYNPEDPSWVVDMPSDIKELLHEGQRQIAEVVNYKNKKTGFHSNPEIELNRTRKWLQRRQSRKPR